MKMNCRFKNVYWKWLCAECGATLHWGTVLNPTLNRMFNMKRMRVHRFDHPMSPSSLSTPLSRTPWKAAFHFHVLVTSLSVEPFGRQSVCKFYLLSHLCKYCIGLDKNESKRKMSICWRKNTNTWKS